VLKHGEQVHAVPLALVAGRGELGVVPRPRIHEPTQPAALRSSQVVSSEARPSVATGKSSTMVA